MEIKASHGNNDVTAAQSGKRDQLRHLGKGVEGGCVVGAGGARRHNLYPKRICKGFVRNQGQLTKKQQASLSRTEVSDPSMAYLLFSGCYLFDVDLFPLVLYLAFN